MWRDPQVAESMARTMMTQRAEIEKLRQALEEAERARDCAFAELSKRDALFLKIGELMESDSHGHGWVLTRAKRMLHCVQCRVHYLVSPETMADEIRKVFDDEATAAKALLCLTSGKGIIDGRVYEARAPSDSGDLDFEEMRDPTDEDEDEFNEVD